MVSNRQVGRYGLAVCVALGAFRMFSPAEAHAQTRECLLSGSLTTTLPGPNGGTYALSQPSTLVETGPFLYQAGNPTSLAATLTFSPPMTATPPWLLAPILETMGNCEGPPTFSSADDGGVAVTNFGTFGQITDTFTVQAVGSSYTIAHSLSGTLNLGSLTNLTGAEPITRNANITLGLQSGSGTVSILGPTGTLLQGAFSANYTIHNPGSTVFPWPCVLQSTFQTPANAAGAFVGSVVRTNTTPAPAAPTGWLSAIALLLLPAGVWAIRRAPRAA